MAHSSTHRFYYGFQTPQSSSKSAASTGGGASSSSSLSATFLDPNTWGVTCLEITQRAQAKGIDLSKVLRAHRTADALSGADLAAALATLGVPFTPQRTMALHAALAQVQATSAARMAATMARCAMDAENTEHGTRRTNFFDELARSTRPPSMSKADVIGELAQRLAIMQPNKARSWLARGRRLDAADRGALTVAELDKWLHMLGVALDDPQLDAIARRFPSRLGRPGELIVDDAAFVKAVHPELAAARRQAEISGGFASSAESVAAAAINPCWSQTPVSRANAFAETPQLAQDHDAEPTAARTLHMTPKNDVVMRLAAALEGRGIAHHAMARAFLIAGADERGTATARQAGAALLALGMTIGADAQSLVALAQRFPAPGVAANDASATARAGMLRALETDADDALDLLTLDWTALVDATRPSHSMYSTRGARTLGGARSANVHFAATPPRGRGDAAASAADRLEQLVRSEPAIVALGTSHRAAVDMCRGAPELLRLLIETKAFERGRDVRTFFRMLDMDASGRVCRSELSRGLSAIGASLGEEVVDLLYTLLDPDGDGWINFRHLAHFLRQSDDGGIGAGGHDSSDVALGTLAARFGSDTFTPSEPTAKSATTTKLSELMYNPIASQPLLILARKAHQKASRVDALLRRYMDSDTGFLDVSRVIAFSMHVGAPVSHTVAQLLLDAVGEQPGLASPYVLAAALSTAFYGQGALGRSPVLPPPADSYSPTSNVSNAPWLSPRAGGQGDQAAAPSRVLRGDPAHRGDLLVAIASKAHQRGFSTASRILPLFGHGTDKWGAHLQNVTKEQVVSVVARIGWQLSDDEADKLMAYFDVNNDGNVSPVEVADALSNALTRVGYDSATVAPMAHRESTLNQEQLRHLAEDRKRLAREAELSATPGKKMTAWGETQHFARQGDLLARIAMKAEQRAKSFGQLFRLFNGDGDGRLSAEEVRRGVSLLGWSLTDDELAGLMADFDTDGDGTVSQRELALAIERVIGRFK
ncbi:EF-hand domain-containing protein [Pseudoscourfieldia marina]